MYKGKIERYKLLIYVRQVKLQRRWAGSMGAIRTDRTTTPVNTHYSCGN